MCQVSTNTIVSCFDVGMSSLPSNKTICLFFSTFPLIAGYEEFERKRQYDIQMCQVSTNTIVSCFDVGVSSSPSNKTICLFFSTFPLIAGYEEFERKRQYDIQVCQVSTHTFVSCFDVGVSSLPSNKTVCSFLVHFLLLLANETLNVNDNMIFKCVKLVQILSSVVLIWVCLSRPAIRPFVYFLVHFLLLLAMKNLNVNDNMIFVC